MARGVNKVFLIGHLGQDPETRFLPSGRAVANVNVATSESWRDKQTGQQQERTEWHRVVFFNRLAEVVGEYLRKGSKVYVEGSLRTRKWQDKDGRDQYTTEIVVSDLQMLDSRRAGGDSQQRGNQQTGHSSSQEYRDASGGSHRSAPPQQGGGSGGDPFDDDIPFNAYGRETWV